MRFNDKGVAVRLLQQRLLDEGYKLPIYGVDGHLGDETWDALQQYAGEQGVRWNPEVPPEVMKDLFEETTRVEVPAPPAASAGPVKVFDMQHHRKPTRPPLTATGRPKWRMARGIVVERNPRNVTGVTIHQTATEYGLTDRQIDAAGGDKNLALAHRALNIACHNAAFEGFYVRTTPLQYYVQHGNGFNASELGLEIAGLYPGVVGGKTWNGRAATKLTEDRIEAARAALADLVTRGRNQGMPIRFLHAHRQSSASRRDDPGEEIWKAVVLEFAVPQLGLKLQQERVIGDGRPVPKEWDPKGVGSY